MDQVNAERYQRQVVLPDFGQEGQDKLLRSKVLVIGAGGLGVPVLQYLTGMGVGTIGLVDGDVVSLSNLQRQVIYSESDIGLLKVDASVARLRQLNSSTTFNAYPEMLSEKNAIGIVAGYDVVVDCTDDIATRYLINDTCVELQLPFVYGALYRHEGQVSVFNYNGSPTYRDAFKDDTASVQNCNEIGVLGVLPGIIGTYQAMEVVKLLTGVGELLAGKLLVIDAARMEHHVFQVDHSRTPSRINKKKEPSGDYISWAEMEGTSESEFHFIDIRSNEVFQQSHDKRFENIPLESIAQFAPKKPFVILVCQQGKSSQQAANLLHASFPKLKIFQIKGGYNSL
jgi:adenylyltransferase/sulfurtransferase